MNAHSPVSSRFAETAAVAAKAAGARDHSPMSEAAVPAALTIGAAITYPVNLSTSSGAVTAANK